MKIVRTASILIGSILIIFCAFKASKSIIEYKDLNYVQENPLVKRDIQEDRSYLEDIDKMISHGVAGAEETTLPVKYEDNYTIYEDDLYVTNNEGKTWMQVPNDSDIGYARISDYLDIISYSNIYTSNEEATIVYGGRGSENISIITTNSQGEHWSVGSISKTATHDLENGYDRLYIDFLDEGKMGYLVGIRNEGTATETVLVYRSVNTGVTWDSVDVSDADYDETLARFGL